MTLSHCWCCGTSGTRHRLKRKRILHRILRCEGEETGGMYPNGPKAAQTHSMCQTQEEKSTKDMGLKNSVCTWVLSQGHKAVSIDNRQGGLQQNQKNLQSPLHSVQEMVQKQGHFTDNLLEYRCIWFGCLDNSCYATQRFTFFLSYSEKLCVHIAWTSKVRVKQGKAVFVIYLPCPLRVSAEHCHPSTSGMSCPRCAFPHKSLS